MRYSKEERELLRQYGVSTEDELKRQIFGYANHRDLLKAYGVDSERDLRRQIFGR